jgi:hypothetical protein
MYRMSRRSARAVPWATPSGRVARDIFAAALAAPEKTAGAPPPGTVV